MFVSARVYGPEITICVRSPKATQDAGDPIELTPF